MRGRNRPERLAGNPAAPFAELPICRHFSRLGRHYAPLVNEPDRIDELRAAVHGDPKRVAETASRLAAEARAAGRHATLSRVLAVLGRARQALGAIELAEADLAEALAAANAAGDAELAADAHLGTAGVYAFTGRSAEALSHLDAVHRLGSPRIRAYANLQQAALEQRTGRPHDALAGYERALPALRGFAARVTIALVLMNRGVIHTQLGDCAAAVADLAEAEQLFAADGNAYAVAQTWHGLGWAYAGRGDLATALRYLDRAADRFHELGHSAPEVEVDRGEVLLAAGLCGLAAQTAREAARRQAAAGNNWQVAQAWLLCARAYLADGDRTAAAGYAERARALFAEHGSAAWERAARLELIRAGGRPADVTELRELAGSLDEAGNARVAASALALAGAAAVDSGDLELATVLSAECMRRADRLGVFEVRMQARYATAACAAARGDDVSARRQVRTGLADLRRHRASVAATDAQTAVAIHAGQLAALGLRLALRSGSASRVLDCMERVRDAGPARPAPLPPEDSALATRLTELRAVAARMRTAEAEGRDTADLLRGQRHLERLIHRRRLRTAAGDVGFRTFSALRVADLRRALAGGCLIALAEIDDRLVGVTVGPSRRTRLQDLGPSSAARDAVAAARSASRALLTDVAGRGRDARLALLRRAVGALDAVCAPLVDGGGPVVLVVPAALHGAPWQLLPSLAGRPVAVAPSASWWLSAVSQGHRPVRGPAVVVAGPRLAAAAGEAAAVARRHPRAVLLTGAAATTGAVLAAMAGAAVAHVACHGRIRDDNALWSSLELFDGPLYLYDLERHGRMPPLVVLSGCDTGVGVRVGDQLIGLSTVLLRHGTRSLVAARCAIPDSPVTGETMAALHGLIAGGASAGQALAELSAGWDRGEPVALVAGALGCFGES